MKIHKITNGPMKQNCYVLEKENKAIVIDPGLGSKQILKFIDDNNLSVEAVLLTHGHFDHIYTAKELKDRGAKIYISEIDAPKLLDNELNIGQFVKVKVEPVLPDGFLEEGKCEIFGQEFEIVFAPGHTSGSILIIYKDNVFTGDTYFSEGVYGRTDLLDGNQEVLEKTLQKINKIIKKNKVFAGHE